MNLDQKLFGGRAPPPPPVKPVKWGDVPPRPPEDDLRMSYEYNRNKIQIYQVRNYAELGDFNKR